MNTHQRRVFLALILVTSSFSFAQSQPAPNPYAPILDRLQSVSERSMTGWTIIAGDMPHGEIPPTMAVTAQDLNIGSDFHPPAWIYREIEIPKEVNGYEIQGSMLKLDVNIGGNEGLMITTFANGNMIARTDEDGQVPITITTNAQPADKIVIALRVLPSAGVGCCGGELHAKLDHAQLLITPPVNRPDPAVLRLELMSAQLLVAAYPDGKAEREQTLDAAVRAIDIGALDNANQQAFDASLRAAQAKLDALRPYMQQFSISAIGNSHIDMAWLWP